MQRIWRARLVALFVGLVLGVGVGLAIGQYVWPVRFYDTDISDLRPQDRDAFVVLVSEAYELSGDVDAARASLVLLEVPDTPGYLMEVADRLLVAGESRSAGRVRRLGQAMAGP